IKKKSEGPHMATAPKAIEDKTFSENEKMLAAMRHVKEAGSNLHLLGLLSDGGVHSHIQHLYALLEMAKSEQVKNVYIHAILDGRDVGPMSARTYLTALEDKIAKLGVGKVATVAGRYYTMDRDKRWERVKLAYRAMVYGEGEVAASSLHALENAYDREETDEFVLPTVILEGDRPRATINSLDAVFFFNYRPDRARQITHTLIDAQFTEFDRGLAPPLPMFTCMTQYDETIDVAVAYPPDHPRETFGEVVATAGLRQLRIAETEKYAHITFFFSGGEEKCYEGEERILIPSPKVPTYNLKPEMSAPEVTECLLEEIRHNRHDVIILNYANADMVGHTGELEAAIRAVETVDTCLEKVVSSVLAQGGVALVTSDHGNAEQMTSGRAGHTFTAHTLNPVPFILVSQTPSRLRKHGILADVAPTMLELLQLPQPAVMTGSSLLIPVNSKK
ncbi:MAG: 2,3-bisphosphoglycerate-independent phosphoglycerate mutase, partial [Firmicutes bacterium]|nr:2,3-bisphosphoglycerate-independent phosphoglycerate mutase [Bacillota bacterium]